MLPGMIELSYLLFQLNRYLTDIPTTPRNRHYGLGCNSGNGRSTINWNTVILQDTSRKTLDERNVSWEDSGTD